MSVQKVDKIQSLSSALALRKLSPREGTVGLKDTSAALMSNRFSAETLAALPGSRQARRHLSCPTLFTGKPFRTVTLRPSVWRHELAEASVQNRLARLEAKLRAIDAWDEAYRYDVILSLFS